jgi:hypothetical protein
MFTSAYVKRLLQHVLRILHIYYTVSYANTGLKYQTNNSLNADPEWRHWFMNYDHYGIWQENLSGNFKPVLLSRKYFFRLRLRGAVPKYVNS